MKNNTKGFTLIELLVVISIIGLLSSVVLASLQSARINARDSLRIQSTAQIQKALELYYSDNNAYPITGNTQSAPYPPDNSFITQLCYDLGSGGGIVKSPNELMPGLVPKYISQIQTDPSNSNPCYAYSSDGKNYKFVKYNVLEKDLLTTDIFYDSNTTDNPKRSPIIYSNGAKLWNTMDSILH